MGASQRRKGAAGEREWCAQLKEAGYLEAERNLTQVRAGGGDVPVPPTLYEVKRYHSIAVRRFLDQAQDALKRHTDCTRAVVAMREDGRTDWMILMRAEDYFALLALSRGLGWNLPKMGLEGLL